MPVVGARVECTPLGPVGSIRSTSKLLMPHKDSSYVGTRLLVRCTMVCTPYLIQHQEGCRLESISLIFLRKSNRANYTYPIYTICNEVKKKFGTSPIAWIVTFAQGRHRSRSQKLKLTAKAGDGPPFPRKWTFSGKVSQPRFEYISCAYRRS